MRNRGQIRQPERWGNGGVSLLCEWAGAEVGRMHGETPAAVHDVARFLFHGYQSLFVVIVRGHLKKEIWSLSRHALPLCVHSNRSHRMTRMITMRVTTDHSHAMRAALVLVVTPPCPSMGADPVRVLARKGGSSDVRDPEAARRAVNVA